MRLTKHDGTAMSVQELGAMGIKSVFNGRTPSSLPWKTFDDVCNHIDNERKTIGEIDHQLSQKVKNYFNINDDFKQVSNYKTGNEMNYF